MSHNPDEVSYEDVAANLLAQIADLLLTGKQDWKVLERLQEALVPEIKSRKRTGVLEGNEIKGETSITAESTSGIIKHIYAPKIEEQLKVDREMLKYASDIISKQYVDNQVVSTSNPSQWTWTEHRKS